MPTMTDNTQFNFPGEAMTSQRGNFDVIRSQQFIELANTHNPEQVAERFPLKTLFGDQAVAGKIIIDTTELELANQARFFASHDKNQLTFDDIEPFLDGVGGWLEFDRKEVVNNGRPL
ncbi:MAG: hypothetical protein JWO07_580 [Candidatus Saccharibacteria bacterium]|nr:hypothetical protein [Candidatus Saccharibacteria bacterium]